MQRKEQKTTKNKVKKLKAKKKYYVRVRTYKTVKGKKVYSSWSKVKSIKTNFSARKNLKRSMQKN